MVLVRIAAVLVLCGPVAAQEVAQDAGPASASVVKVVVTQGEGEPRVAAGFVVADGRVVTTLKCLEKATAVEVVLASGVARRASGVEAYQHEANLALLVVEWEGAAPAALRIAESPPRVGAVISILLPAPGDPDAAATIASEPRGPVWSQAAIAYPFTTSSETIGLSWAGAPLVEEGRVVGVVTGKYPASIGLSLSLTNLLPSVVLPPKEQLYSAARPDILRSLRAGRAIEWGWWKEYQENMRSAEALLKEAESKGKQDRGAATLAAEKALTLDPRCWRAWRTLCWLYSEEKSDLKALHASERTIGLMPTDPYAYMVKAAVLARQGRHEEAIAAGRKAVDLNAKDYRAHLYLGYAYHFAGRYEEAVAEYEQVLKLNPSNQYVKGELFRLHDLMREKKKEEPKVPVF